MNKPLSTIWAKIQRIFTVDDMIMDETFTLGDRGDEQHPPVDPEEQSKSPFDRNLLSEVKNDLVRIDALLQEDPEKIPDQLDEALTRVKAAFRYPANADIIIREFNIALKPQVRGAAVFLEGLTDKNIINSHILEPLMLLSNLDQNQESLDPGKIVKEELLPGNQVMEYHHFKEAVENILAGSTAVFINGFGGALVVETKGWEHRAPERPQTEMVVQGPSEGFVENLRVNVALIRRRLKTDRLVTEILKVGRLSNTDVAVLYLDGITNPKLVSEVKRRIRKIEADFVSSGMLEQFIEDSSWSIIPQAIWTERPDRAASMMGEGHVIVVIDGNPFALMVPTTFFSLLHSSEDAYLRWPVPDFLRLLRIMSILASVLVPGAYVAVTNYHPEMIPTDLMLAIAASREKIPYPTVVEVFVMEFTFELIREAGVRLPSVIGPTIGIVGAVILGQAAVSAGIISPILVVVVAITGLSSFAIPNYAFSYAVRIFRFVFLLLGSVLGFYGLALGLFVVTIHLTGIKSFGVPMMSPVAPYRPPSGDVVLRMPIFTQEKRPKQLRPLDEIRQAAITRPWDPASHDSEEAQPGAKEDE